MKIVIPFDIGGLIYREMEVTEVEMMAEVKLLEDYVLDDYPEYDVPVSTDSVHDLVKKLNRLQKAYERGFIDSHDQYKRDKLEIYTQYVN
mgnify:CR=1 FL=1